MAASITHAFESAKADGSDDTLVQPTDWNAEHDVSGLSLDTHTHQAFPIGAVFIAVVSTDPATLLGYGTWSAFAAGRVLVGLDSEDTDFDTVEETGGEKTHILSEAEMPAHTHTLTRDSDVGGGNRVRRGSGAGTSSEQTSSTTGNSDAHNNVQPYIVVYMWKRTA